ncbi:Mago nashi superfamily, partial [Sesbania bispinosa]
MGSEEENGEFYLRYYVGHKGSSGTSFWSLSSDPMASSVMPTTPTTKMTPSFARRFTSLLPFFASAVVSLLKA